MHRIALDRESNEKQGKRLRLGKEISLEDIFNELRELQRQVGDLTGEHRQMGADTSAIRELLEEDR